MTAPAWPRLPLPFRADVTILGPRRWWDGPLDVEGLAVGSVSAAVAAANALARARGSQWSAVVASGLVGASFDSIGRLRVDGQPVASWAPLSGFFRAADGWIRLHGNYPHHAAAIAAALGTQDRDGVERATASWAALDLEDAVRAAGGIAGAVRTPQQWRAHPQHQVTASGAGPLTLEPATGAVAPLPAARGLPLSGLAVLDLTRVIAGPTCTRFLGALGADVLRVDAPHQPELREAHLDTGFGKHSAVADLRDPDQRAAVRSLAGTADVVITGYRPGALAAFGLDRESLLAEHPSLVVVDLSAWGEAGPWRSDRGFDSIVQAVTGIAHRYAADGRPGALPVQALDHAAGYLMAAAAMRLLTRRPFEGGASASLSLAAVSQVLSGMPAAAAASEGGPPDAVDGPDHPLWVERVDSPHGALDHVRPPVLADGVPMSFPSAPTAYGESLLQWWADPSP